MELVDAISLVAKGKGQYQAFEKLDETLVFIQQAHAKLGDTKRQQEALEKEIHDLEVDRDKLKQLKMDLEKDVASATKEKDDAIAMRNARLVEEEKALESERLRLKKEDDAKRVKDRTDMTVFEKQMNDKKMQLENDVQKLQQRKDELTKSLQGALGAVQSG
jgi:chromosome segregation ATPase